jgi:hypothetical protein
MAIEMIKLSDGGNLIIIDRQNCTFVDWHNVVNPLTTTDLDCSNCSYNYAYGRIREICSHCSNRGIQDIWSYTIGGCCIDDELYRAGVFNT